MHATRPGLPRRIFKRLDQDEVDRETSLSEGCTCDARFFGIGLSTTTTTFADERSVIKSRAGEYRDSNGSLCNPTLFATGKKGSVYSTTGRHPLSFTVHVPTLPSQLAGINQGLPIPGATEVLLHSRDRSIGARHAYLQRKVYSPNSRFSFPRTIPLPGLVMVYPKAVILTRAEKADCIKFPLASAIRYFIILLNQ